MRWIILLALSLPTFASALINPDGVVCTAWMRDPDGKGPVLNGKLSRSKIDPQYFELTLGDYSFGADYSFLKQDGIGLIVFNNKSKSFAESTPGFRTIGSSKQREADLKFYDKLADGRSVVAGLQCGFTAP